jgi:V/A-type H+-transporting ATPase subunit K
MRHFDESEENMKTKICFQWMSRMLVAGVFLLGSSAWADEVKQAATAGDQPSVYRTIGLGLAAAISIGLSVLGAGYAVGRIGSAAMGAIAEKPELLPRAILFIALGEGLAILGFAVAMMMLQKI